jgi:citrate synthase
MTESAKLIYQNHELDIPVLEGSEGEKGLVIDSLRKGSGLITLDNGFANTGSCESSITFLQGEEGILRYRGYPIEQLAEKSSFLETAYLLIYGKLPNLTEWREFRNEITTHSLIHEDMKHFFEGFPVNAHPMAILSAMICSLSAYYPGCLDRDLSKEKENEHFIRLLSKIITIAAFSYKKSIGQPLVYPRNDLKYCANFLNMMFAVPAESYEVDPDMVNALNLLLILHADHEQNCSTSTVRLVGSSDANIYAAISAGICALWGPLHGGANQAVIQMLDDIHTSGKTIKEVVAAAKDKSNSFRLMGFGHRVYKNYDPRATILKKTCDVILSKKGMDDPCLEIAKQLEEVALNDEYFIEKKLYPNVDFYSGILYRAMGFPINMFTVMFALGRLPGWIAHYKEMNDNPASRIGRPRQIYQGPMSQDYVPLEKRS